MSVTRISALIHTCNNERSLGRVLDSLRPCDDVLVVDHGSRDATIKVAREHGTRIIIADSGVDWGTYVRSARNQWILCLLPQEALAEELEAALFEWSEQEHDNKLTGFNLAIRAQSADGWKLLGPEMRLVNRAQIRWSGELPPANAAAPALAGYLLRIPEED